MGVLTGKAVVITGAGQGLGRAFARHAANASAALVVNDIGGALAEEVSSSIRDAGGTAVAHAGSVADTAEADTLIRQCVTEFGAIDGLVNNAGLNYRALPWEDDPARIRALIEVNVLGALYCGTAASRAMHARRRGVIVNIASGSVVGQRRAAAYSASKGAIASMTFSWAVDLAEFGVRVNAVAPLAPDQDGLGQPNDPAAVRFEPTARADRADGDLPAQRLSSEINGQLIRLTGDKLHVVRQPAIKEPVLQRER
jgi:NAD(P)-dependent dehydrogenase (short-subunit alcohol dehydrogenase family)